MAEGPDSLTLGMLHQVDGKVDTLLDCVHDLTARVGSLEDQMVGMRSDLVELRHGMDKFDQCLQRIERRLDLYDPDARAQRPVL
ncbi:MAG: hypothetical protein ACHQAY_24630 [Hyphomicrobiales bacterium]